jgi:uncharacterized heparinase superfamily protein
MLKRWRKLSLVGELARTIRTVRPLKSRQIAWLMFRRLRPVTLAKIPAETRVAQRAGVSLIPRPCNCNFGWRDGWTFTFIGTERTFPVKQLDWHPTDVSRLWRYNLHYFDYLLNDECPVDVRDVLLDDWIVANPPGTRDAWEPFPTSLRIVNWIDYLLRTAMIRPMKAGWLRSLFEQASCLERNVEYHILANHVFKNGVALLFAGVFFEGRDAKRWLKLGIRILESEIDEQFLPDGGHFERSPMYHAIVTQDVLDVINLLRSMPSAPPGLMAVFKDKARAALAFLDGILHPDGDIPLFNDSAIGIALHPAVLRAYAERVVGAEALPPLRNEDLCVHAFSETGFYACRHGGDHLIVDCGPIGPNYQPGHAHCDTLSFELSIDGERLIVDSGVSGYEDDPLRAYIRSTAAHNTVRVNGIEQSEVWGTFRVGRRAKPLFARIERIPDNRVYFEGAHDAYRHLSQHITHQRRISYGVEKRTWCITDLLEGAGEATVEAFFHFAPNVVVTWVNRHLIVRANDRSGDQSGEMRVVLNGWDNVGIGKAAVCLRFGECVESFVIVLTTRRRLPIEASFMLSARRAA